MRLTIVVEEQSEAQIADTLDLISRQVFNGFTSGFDHSEVGRYLFDVSPNSDGKNGGVTCSSS